jgi:hypothetical protein
MYISVLSPMKSGPYFGTHLPVPIDTLLIYSDLCCTYTCIGAQWEHTQITDVKLRVDLKHMHGCVDPSN